MLQQVVLVVLQRPDRAVGRAALVVEVRAVADPDVRDARLAQPPNLHGARDSRPLRAGNDARAGWRRDRLPGPRFDLGLRLATGLALEDGALEAAGRLALYLARVLLRELAGVAAVCGTRALRERWLDGAREGVRGAPPRDALEGRTGEPAAAARGRLAGGVARRRAERLPDGAAGQLAAPALRVTLPMNSSFGSSVSK